MSAEQEPADKDQDGEVDHRQDDQGDDRRRPLDHLSAPRRGQQGGEDDEAGHGCQRDRLHGAHWSTPAVQRGGGRASGDLLLHRAEDAAEGEDQPPHRLEVEVLGGCQPPRDDDEEQQAQPAGSEERDGEQPQLASPDPRHAGPAAMRSPRRTPAPNQTPKPGLSTPTASDSRPVAPHERATAPAATHASAAAVPVVRGSVAATTPPTATAPSAPASSPRARPAS